MVTHSGRSLVWFRTSACHADDPGSNLGGRTTLCFLSTFVEKNEQKQVMNAIARNATFCNVKTLNLVKRDSISELILRFIWGSGIF